MRFWLREDERRPDPEPVQTDDRRAIAVGMVLWVLVLGALLLVGVDELVATGRGWWLWACAAGLGFGLLGLVVVQLRRR